MIENRYEQDGPWEKAPWKLIEVIVKGMAVSRENFGGTPGHAGRKESLKLIRYQMVIRIFHATLMPEGDKPGRGQDDKNKNTEPEPHSENLFQVFLNDQKDEDTQARYYNSNKSFRIECKGA